jgi:hypothetical protein
MKYLCLVYYEEKTINAMSQSEWQSLNEECVACGEARPRGWVVLKSDLFANWSRQKMSDFNCNLHSNFIVKE